MKHILLLVLFIISFLSCNTKSSNGKIENGFVKKEGTYFFNKKRIKLAELKDGSLTFAIIDKDGQLLLQHNLFLSFNKNQKWALYIDNNENIWFYNSDFGETMVWLKEDSSRYIQYDYCTKDITIPPDFLNYFKKNKIHLCN